MVDKLSPEYFEFMAKKAREYNLVIAGGSSARRVVQDIYNSSFVFFPDGRKVEQRKNYLTHWENENGIKAGQEIMVVDSQWGKIVQLICYDVEFPDISTKLAANELSLILVPSMTESVAGQFRVRWTSQARAVEHSSYVVISPTVGKVMDGWEHFGQATFLTPQLKGFSGLQLQGEEKQDGVWMSELDMESLLKSKKESHWRPSKQIKK